MEFEATLAADERREAQEQSDGELPRGTTIGRYVVVGKLGAGANGVVYAAHDPELDRRVALKFLLLGADGEAARARLLREAQALAKLSHPNVVSVHDVGTHGERVWIAMEFVAGRTLGAWAAAQGRSWRQALAVLADVARGLAVAHDAGLVHRDLKPDNVMVGDDDRVRVMDFGLAHGRGMEVAELGLASTAVSDTKVPPELAALALYLTQVGSIQGTPAYMAPEQWEGKEATAAADQFSWGVTAWELLYGERPFVGVTVVALAATVLLGKRQPPVKGRKVPAWLRRIVERALAPDPRERWPSMHVLLRIMERGLLQTRVRQIGLVGIGVVALAVIGLVGYPRWEASQRIAAQVAAAIEENERAELLYREMEELRAAVTRAFDAGKSEEAETLWAQYLGKVPGLESGLIVAAQQLESALFIAPWRDDVREHLLDTLLRRALFVEQQRRGALEVQEQIGRLMLYDVRGDHIARWNATAQLTIDSTPSGARVVLERYIDESGYRRIARAEELGSTPIASQILERSSYRLRFDLPGHAQVLYPILLARDEQIAVHVTLPPTTAIPEGFVYIPAGRFLYGSDAAEDSRGMLATEPMRTITTGSYLIGRFEVTYGDWLAFLAELPTDRRTTLLAAGGNSPQPDGIRLSQLDNGWQLELNQGERTYIARTGELLSYVGRTVRTSVEWERLPVSGISAAEASEFMAWLDRSGRVPDARFCNEYEWERAARGADDRDFPDGDVIDSSAANISTTYGRVSSAFGPDPVGSYPQTVSPFGLYDTVGNVYELTVSPHNKDIIVARSGAYYFDSWGARAANRWEMPADFRNPTAGLRVCATWPHV